jgi:hypothetical protein
MSPSKQGSVRELSLKKSTTSVGKSLLGGDSSPVKSMMKPGMMFRIKTYLYDAVDGLLMEPVATAVSGEPTGNLTDSELQNIKEMKKKFRLKEAPKKESKTKIKLDK